ncbi:inositol monophosphatase family protein [Sneathiella chinensis]|uniref:Histidinol-phosphatase n=1 Tax=Sneathiella chinensis TaxID=349750 RepID=A0ABQ5U0S8_9PROT|nr:inositol monophosphatase family protein [Sneathiella chinensis]GLQ05423.1 histidinol-phosphatase [Sneathiella chinensis]
MTKECPRSFIDLAHRLADAAGEVIRPLYRQKLDIISKEDASPVTIADRNAEMAMRKIIEAEFPDHGIYGEEHGQVRTDAEYVWVLDPIDGTHSFISGSPTFTCLIGLVRNGAPVMGLMYQPISGERWVGANGVTTLNDVPIQTRDAINTVEQASLFSWGVELFKSDRGPEYERLCTSAARKRFGYDSYAYGLLAHGFVDLVADFDMKPFDYCALVPIVENAGGVMSDWDGNPLTLTTPGYVLASGNEALHQQALALLSRD